MQRDVSGEIIVAAVAVLIIVLGLVLGVLLSLPSGVNNQSVEATGISVVVSEPAESMTTNVTTVESVTATELAAATATETATETEEPEPTVTHTVTSEIKTRATETPTQTPTERLTATETSSRTPSPTRTATFTAEPTATDTPTRTATATPSPEDTATPIIAIATATASKTHTPDPTLTSTETASTEIPVESPTESATLKATATPTERVCYRPAGWVDYVVKSGDTLFKIAQATRTTVSELQRVNCIDNIDRIIAGTRLFIPNNGTGDGDGGNFPGGVGYGRVGCTNNDIARISNVYPLQRVGSSFSVTGTAYLDDLWYYKLEIQSDETGEIHFWSQSSNAVKNGVLGEIMTGGFDSGIYWVRLVVVYPRGDTPPENICAIPVYFP